MVILILTEDLKQEAKSFKYTIKESEGAIPKRATPTSVSESKQARQTSGDDAKVTKTMRLDHAH